MIFSDTKKFEIHKKLFKKFLKHFEFFLVFYLMFVKISNATISRKHNLSFRIRINF